MAKHGSTEHMALTIWKAVLWQPFWSNLSLLAGVPFVFLITLSTTAGLCIVCYDLPFVAYLLAWNLAQQSNTAENTV